MASNEETFRVGPAQSSQAQNVTYPGEFRCGKVRVLNENGYPVEVTVRRVTEKVVYENTISGTSDGFAMLSHAETENITADKGFRSGQRVRVTVEPLD